jgi:hypothetical protein
MTRAGTVCLVFLASVTCGFAQSEGRRGDTYASIAQLPDWSGVWVIPFGKFLRENLLQRVVGDPLAPPLTPAFAEVLAGQRQGSPTRKATNAERCLPNGMPNVMRYAFAIEFLFTPGRVTILLEQDGMIRRVFTDGRSHSKDPDPGYGGESIGRWEGDTLVVETTAISPRAELMAGVPTSGQARVTERIRLRNSTQLEIASVVEDPVALTMPWRRTHVYERTNIGFYEHICMDNNRDRDRADPDLTPPDQRGQAR